MATCPLYLGACILCFGGFDTLVQPVGCSLLWPHTYGLQLSLTASPLVTRFSSTGQEDEH